MRSTWKRSVKPKLTLQGDWMEAAGFTIGNKVSITVTNNKLIIENDN
ncbi:SymE family type I addiction module toxin [Flavobacterium sp. RHBU_3]